MSVNLSALFRIKAEAAAKKATVVAVSKTKPVADILEVYHAGHKIFGENYVQELVDKQLLLPADIEWHFIGHLQSNKVKFIAPFVSLIHGADSFGLLKEINKQALKNKRVIPCLLQIYIATEETKFGFSVSEATMMLQSPEFSDLKNIEIRGLMGMASFSDNVELIKNEFKGLSGFYLQLKASYPWFSILSMGMTGDYKIALDQGSTMIRIGSAIFGHR